MKKYFDEQLPGFLANFEKLLTANNNGDGYFIGTEVGDNKPNNTTLPMTVHYLYNTARIIDHYCVLDIVTLCS